MATYQAINACTWRTDANGWIPNHTPTVRQGVWAGNENVGVMVFDLEPILTTFATYYPIAARLRLTRTGAGAYSYNLLMTLYAGNQVDIPALGVTVAVPAARPEKISEPYTYVVPAGQTAKTIEIDAALIDTLCEECNCLFIDAGNSTANYLGFVGRDDLSKVILEIDWTLRKTACGAPNVAVDSTLAENAVTLSWSGATAGIENAITGYEIQYSDSTDNATWGTWTALTSVSTPSAFSNISVTPPATRGNYRRYRVRTLGSAGESYYSAWAVSSNTLRKNQLPVGPSSLVALPAIFENSEVSLSWPVATDPDNAISRYQIQYAVSSNGTSWGSWVDATTNATGTEFTHNPTLDRGQYIKYQIRAIDVLNAPGSYTESAAIRRNSAPSAPTVTFPQAEAVTYNPRPRVLATIGSDADGQQQSISIDGYTVSSPGLQNIGKKVVLRRSANAGTGNQNISVIATDSLGATNAASRVFVYSAAVFTDPLLQSGGNKIKASHMTELRDAVNLIRAYYGMDDYEWAESIAAGTTSSANWINHVNELRTAIEQIVAYVNAWDAGSTTNDIVLPTWLEITDKKPRADVMTQLRNVIAML